MSLFGSISNFISSLAPSDNNTVTQILGKNLPSSSSSSSSFLPQTLFSSKQQDQAGKPLLTHASNNCQQINNDSTRTQSTKQRQTNAEYLPRQDINNDNQQDEFILQAELTEGEQESNRKQTREDFDPRTFHEDGLEAKRPKPQPPSLSSSQPSSSSSSSYTPSALPFGSPSLTTMQPQELNVAPRTHRPQENASEFQPDDVNHSTRNLPKKSDDHNSSCPGGMKRTDDGLPISNDFVHPSLQASSVQISPPKLPSSTSSSSSSSSSSTQFSTSASAMSVQMPISQSFSSSQLQVTSSKSRDEPSFASDFPRGLVTSPTPTPPSSSSAPQSSSASAAEPPPPPSSGCLDELIPDLSFLSEEERKHIEDVMMRATAMQFNDRRRSSGFHDETGSDWIEDASIEPPEK